MKKFYRTLPGKIRHLIEKLIKKYDGGEFYSGVLRSLYKSIYNIHIGIGSYGCFNVEQFPEGTKIGNYCSIGPRVYYLYSNHPMDTASTHPLFYNKVLGFLKEDRIERVKLTVGNDVWIGANTTITRGCTFIGNGAVIGAGSVVTHNVPAYSIVVGNPARVIRYRFTDDIRQKLDKSLWYDLNPQELAKYIDDVNDVELFIDKINEFRKEK